MENYQTIIQDFQKIINDPNLSKEEKSKKIQPILEEFVFLQLTIQIIPIDRTECMICHSGFSNTNEKLHINSCDCLNSVHQTCLKKKQEEKFFLKPVCLTCLNPISSDILDKSLKNLKANEKIEETCTLCIKSRSLLVSLVCQHLICIYCLKDYLKHKLGTIKTKNLNEILCPQSSCLLPMITPKFMNEAQKYEELKEFYDEFRKNISPADKKIFENIELQKKEKIAHCPKCQENFILNYLSPYLQNTLFRCYSCKNEVFLKLSDNQFEMKKEEEKKFCRIF